jgi:serine-type D-Ala-D-Ala carboxypeptidase/endopeptidase (penicillin-binding protein 4)
MSVGKILRSFAGGVSVGVLGVGVVVGLHERKLATRAVPPVPAVALNRGRITTPVFSLRRLPATVAEPLVTKPVIDRLAAVVPSMPPSSCLVVEADGEVVAEHNPTTPLIPASNMKLVTAAVALEVIGRDHRFVTKLFGQVDATGTKVGDLYVVGGGDPLLSTPKYRDALIASRPGSTTPFTPLESLADQLKTSGITNVTGAVYADDSRYDPSDYGLATWPPGVVSPVGALVANDSRSNYNLAAGAFASQPATWAAEQATAMLRQVGIVVAAGSARHGTPPPDAGLTELAHVESAPLVDIVADMLTWSDNDTAEMLLREIAVTKGKPGTSVGGAEAVREVLASWGVPLDGVREADGSGLDRSNTFTCRAFANVLDHVGATGDLARGLPRPGKPGTLLDRLDVSQVHDALAAKTGTLSGVRALSGFATMADGHVVTFSMIVNDVPGRADDATAAAYKVFATITDTFATFPGTIDLAAFGPTAPVVGSVSGSA